ncbi:hypothetical protein GGI04_002768 [Coemansia thaxteri]|uniref:Tyrosinase copper-binding domain-containing protein n=1 Tax=Coemansia thaxteri TaxID=2663907 RepID=A0A9W8BF72_9FUNG|nr:hypothetical protein H4R26_004282 [Coemansia thaxteri]KAJ2003985.1 hypothetical protein GGI04_002768 [Coemansia thaxteri]KAJ2473395.1 hypothetical protein GGI02_000878 [Coemansia sp. RSA 2322]KAJ2480087.1 hypothetical protein EV174_003824 [Coemansia sp. RSA 2320]
MFKYICIILAVLIGEAVAKSMFPVPRLPGACSQMTVRRDVVTLAPAELQRFIRVVREMHRRGWMDGFGSMHDHISHQIHGNEQFFAWHRRFLRHFELLMQEIDPEAVLPYWNWGTYWNNPLADPVLSAAYFGGNGRPGDNCVLDGAQARWGRNYPTRNCLTRRYRYGTNTGSFWPMRAVRDVMNSARTHAQFRSRIENGAHGIVHLGLGGDFETMYAPVDVLFFLHHATIDKVWAEWQSRDPLRYRSVDGYDSLRAPVTVNSPMPFYGEEVGSALATNGPGYCYVYDDVPAAPSSAFFKSRRATFSALNALVNITSAAPASPGEQQRPERSETAAEATAEETQAEAAEEAAEFYARHFNATRDFKPPSPMGTQWLKGRHMDVAEAARMQAVVNRVVAQINIERRQQQEELGADS